MHINLTMHLSAASYMHTHSYVQGKERVYPCTLPSLLTSRQERVYPHTNAFLILTNTGKRKDTCTIAHALFPPCLQTGKKECSYPHTNAYAFLNLINAGKKECTPATLLFLPDSRIVAHVATGEYW